MQYQKNKYSLQNLVHKSSMYFISSQSSVDRTLAFSCFLPIPSIFSSLLFFLSFFLLIVSFLFPFSCFFPILSSFSSHSSHTEPHTKSFAFPQETLCSLTKWFVFTWETLRLYKYIFQSFLCSLAKLLRVFLPPNTKSIEIYIYINGLCTLLFLFFYFLFLFFSFLFPLLFLFSLFSFSLPFQIFCFPSLFIKFFSFPCFLFLLFVFSFLFFPFLYLFSPLSFFFPGLCTFW